MRGNRLSLGLRATLAIFTVALLATSTWAVSHETVLYSFDDYDGASTYAGLVLDAAGNLYGATEAGGTGCGYGGCGTVFEVSPNGTGGWTGTVLHFFAGPDGDAPAAGLIFDGAGNLYGTTAEGGIHGGGTVFEMSPNGSGGWTETVLHSFGNPATQDGAQPQFAALIFDARGNLYGTTLYGGIHSCGGNGCGTAFELSPREGGGWTETVLHSFGNPATQDGQYPYAGLILDAAGNLYGTTGGGGIHSGGTVFELSPREGGGYTETVLHSFGNPATQDGAGPLGGLISDAAGNLYGTTEYGGIHTVGTAFELSPRQGGGWTETVLHSFGNPATQDGALPSAGLIFDSAGNLYSTTFLGGIHPCQGGGCGTVFELSPREGGGWTETVLHSFNNNGSDGYYPEDGLVLDAHGNLYGTTPGGGIDGAGAVFEITP